MLAFFKSVRQRATLASRHQGVLPWTLASMMLMSSFANVAVSAGTFKQTAISLEQNIQDEDAEVKFVATAPDVGFAVFRVVAPNGLTVIDFKAPSSKTGIRHFKLESAEPKNDGRLLADFPEGTYKFSGTTPGGVEVNGEAMLTHSFPPAASVTSPLPDANNVGASGLRVTWAAVNDIEAITVSIEDEETGQEIQAKLAGSATAFAVPEGFLGLATTYKIAIGTIARNGNKTVTEASFITAKDK